jgi:hypothetical protein
MSTWDIAIVPLSASAESGDIRYGRLARFSPTSVTSSSTHFAFLAPDGSLYSFGSNAQHQILSSPIKSVSIPVRCDWAAPFSFVEIAAGDEFTVGITDSREVITHGAQNATVSWKVPRGLSAYGERYAFAFGDSSVCIATIGERGPLIVEAPEPILFTAVHQDYVAVLGESGALWAIDVNGNFQAVSLSQKVHQISVSPNHFVCVAANKAIFLVDTLYLQTEGFFLPPDFTAIDAVAADGQVIAVNARGELAFSDPATHEMLAAWIPSFPIPSQQPIAFITFHGQCLVFIRGKPRARPAVGDVLVKSATFLSAVNDMFICANSEVAYFGGRNYPASELAAIVATSHSASFVTASGRIIATDVDDKRLFEKNFLRGDRIVFDAQGRHLALEVVGFAERAVWVRRPGASTVAALPPSSLTELSARTIQIDRAGHTLAKVTVSGAALWADTTPAFCATFGYEPGDLIAADPHGIVEFFGVFAAKLLCVDLATRGLFLLDDLPYKVLKRVSKNLPHSLTVVTADGAVVELNISADGPRVFVPTDRVRSPDGEAVIVGFADAPYIQTDEMRMSGYEAARADVFALSLVRRISARAERTVLIGDEPTTVSLSTEDSPNGIFPGDVIFVDSLYGKVVGFRGDEIVARMAGRDECQILTKVPEIVYRADIQATRISRDFPLVFVGSVLIPETLVLPGDIVDCLEIGECEFIGYTDRQTLFVSTETGETFTLSFAMLLYPGFFTLKKRNAFPE